MAHHKSAKKRIRRNARRYAINHNRISRIRTFVKKVELAVQSGNKADAVAALKLAEPELARGVTRGVLHRNNAARKMSRLAASVQAM